MNADKNSDSSNSALPNNQAVSTYLKALERYENERQRLQANYQGDEPQTRQTLISVYNDQSDSSDLRSMRSICPIMLYLTLATCVFSVLAWIIVT